MAEMMMQAKVKTFTEGEIEVVVDELIMFGNQPIRIFCHDKDGRRYKFKMDEEPFELVAWTSWRPKDGWQAREEIGELKESLRIERIENRSAALWQIKARELLRKCWKYFHTSSKHPNQELEDELWDLLDKAEK
jgi:hypothetical protein